MNSPPAPVEQPKPFAERAEKLYLDSARYREALMILGANQLGDVRLRAQGLLREAIARGVKGREP